MKIRGRPLLALIGMSFLWGYSWTGIKMGLLDASPLTFAALRMGIGASCLLLVLPLTGRPFLPRRLPELLKLGLVQTTGLVTLSTWAVHEGTAGRAAFLGYTMPFFTLLMAWPLLGERVRGLQWLSIFLAFLDDENPNCWKSNCEESNFAFYYDFWHFDIFRRAPFRGFFHYSWCAYE